MTAELLAARDESAALIDIRMPEYLPERAAFETCGVADYAAMAGLFDRYSVQRVIHIVAMLSTGIRKNH